MARRSGLGKGLGALIPTEAVGEQGSALREVPIASIRPNALSAPVPLRRGGDVLAGRLHPGGRRAAAGPGPGGRRRGRRELRADRRGAAVACGPPGRPPDDPRAGPDRHRRRPQPRAGAGREPPPGGPQPSRGGRRLPAADRRLRLTHEQVAKRVGKSRATVTNTLRLLQLPAGVQRALAEGTISAGHARALLGTPDRAAPGGAGPADRHRGADGPGRRGWP